jgi:hypothetical protein
MPSSSTCVYVCVGVSWSWALRIRLSHLRSSTADEYGQAEQTKKRVQGALFLLNDRLTQLVFWLVTDLIYSLVTLGRSRTQSHLSRFLLLSLGSVKEFVCVLPYFKSA